jgi:hypothetical protein
MKTLGGFCGALLLVSGLFAQHHGGFQSPQPFMRGGTGSVVYPGGTAATMPNITRTIPNVVYPGGGGPHLVVPGSVTDPTFPQRLAGTIQGQNFGRNGAGRGNGFGNGFGRRGGGSVSVIPYIVPIYVGGYGYGYGYGYGDPSAYYGQPDPSGAPPDQQPPMQQQPNIIIVYPQGPPAGPGAPGAAMAAPPPEAQPAPREEPASTLEPSHYLIALKDHTIYAVVAYWVEGDTLHYFTTGSTHNQASLSLVDRPLTERLNKESGIDIRLPAAPGDK